MGKLSQHSWKPQKPQNFSPVDLSMFNTSNTEIILLLLSAIMHCNQWLHVPWSTFEDYQDSINYRDIFRASIMILNCLLSPHKAICMNFAGFLPFNIQTRKLLTAYLALIHITSLYYYIVGRFGWEKVGKCWQVICDLPN